MYLENSKFSLEQIWARRNSKLTPEEVTGSEQLAAQITTFAADHMEQKRYEEMSDGDLRTYSIGERNQYDPHRKITVQDLMVSVEETRRYRTLTGINELIAKIIIGPYDPPQTGLEAKEEDRYGGIATTSSSHISTPFELRSVLNGLLYSSPVDPRITDWRVKQRYILPRR